MLEGRLSLWAATRATVRARTHDQPGWRYQAKLLAYLPAAPAARPSAPAGAGDKCRVVGAINAKLGEQGYPDTAVAALEHDFDALKGGYG